MPTTAWDDVGFGNDTEIIHRLSLSSPPLLHPFITYKIPPWLMLDLIRCDVMCHSKSAIHHDTHANAPIPITISILTGSSAFLPFQLPLNCPSYARLGLRTQESGQGA